MKPEHEELCAALGLTGSRTAHKAEDAIRELSAEVERQAETIALLGLSVQKAANRQYWAEAELAKVKAENESLRGSVRAAYPADNDGFGGNPRRGPRD